MEELIGKILGHYKILNLLGEGGMGAVFRAHDITLQRDVAVKVLHPHFASLTRFKERFLQEARTAARLEHPDIVQVYDFGQAGSRLYIVMEFIPGGTLGDYFEHAQQQNRAVELRETLRILAQVADALDYAHRRGVIHRDVKPSNILLRSLDRSDREGNPPIRAVVTDFGLAKLLEGGVHTHTGTFMGTLPYMSPEQCLGGEPDSRSDIYSLGVVLYQLTTGQLPFDVKSPTDAVVKHQSEIPPAPREVRSGLPVIVEDVILKATQKQPDDRFANARDMARALRQAADTLTDETVTQYAPPESAISLATQLQTSESISEPSWLGTGVAVTGGGTHLIVARAGQRPRSVPLNKEVLTIGRGDDNDIALDDPKVSRPHARLDLDGTGYRVTDLDSINGTFLGDARLLPGVPEVWTPDKTLRIGDTWLRQVRGGQSAGPAPPPTKGIALVRSDGTTVDPSLVHTSSGEGRVGACIEPAQLVVQPGSSATASIFVLNQGPEVEHFTVSVKGIPAGWVASLPPVIQLMPGQQQEVALTIRPPRSPQSRAGRHPITVRVSSRGEVAEVKGTLTVAAYSHFSSELHPQRLQAGQTARVMVANQGNIPETFTLNWKDRADELAFKPPKTQLRVPEGQAAAAEFRATPRRRHWIGGVQTYSFTTQVGSAKGKPQTHTGELVSRALIPRWVPPLVAASLIALCLLLAYLFIRPPVIRSITVDPPKPKAGQPVTVYWRIDNGQSVDLRPLVYGLDPSIGKYTFAQGFDDTVSLSVVASNGFGSVEESLTIAPPQDPPKVNSLIAEPDTLTNGDASTVRLKWDTEGAETVTIEPAPGPVGPVGLRDVPAPSKDTVYTLIARNQGGETRAEVQVVVKSPEAPEAQIAVEPGTLVIGEVDTIRLTWKTERADTVTIEPGVGTVESAGSRDVPAPSENTVYTLIAGNEGGETQAEAQVVVKPPEAPEAQIAVEPGTLVIGEVDTVRLTWKTERADTVTIEPGVGTVESAGSRDVPAPSENTVYTLIARNEGGETQAEAQVVVEPPEAPEAEIAVEPGTLVVGEVDTVRLTWETQGADTVTIEPGIGLVELAGSRDVPAPSTDTTYILVAKGAGGETRARAQLKVIPFAVTSVTADVDPPEFTGECPKKFDFSARIAVNGRGTVKYTWERSDGATAPVDTITFDAKGSKTVNTSWTLGAEGARWERIRILEPGEMVSDKAHFKLSCDQPRWVLTDEFNLGEDQKSHNWGYSGNGLFTSVYPCDGDAAWRNRGGSFWLTLQVAPGKDFKLVWRTDAAGTRKGHQLIFDVHADGNLIKSYSGDDFDGCSNYEIVVTNPDAYTSDGKVVVKFQDTGPGPPDIQDFIGTCIWIYSWGTGSTGQ